MGREFLQLKRSGVGFEDCKVMVQSIGPGMRCKDALGSMTACHDPCDPKCGIGEWRRTGRCSMSVFVVDIHFRVVDRFLVSVLACLSSASKLVD